MSPEEGFEKAIDPSCITEGKLKLEADPKGRVLWVIEESHAYFVPAGAKPADKIQGLLRSIIVGGIKYKVLPREVSELEKMVEDGSVVDITNLLAEDQRWKG